MAFNESQKEELKLFRGRLLGCLGEVMSNFVSNYEASLTQSSKNLKSGMEDDMRGEIS